MLAETCVDNVSVNLHILEYLVAPMVYLMYDLIDIISRLLLTELKQFRQSVRLLSPFRPLTILRLLLVAVTIITNGSCSSRSGVLRQRRSSSERNACSVLAGIVIAPGHEQFEHWRVHDLLLEGSSGAVTIPFEDVISQEVHRAEASHVHVQLLLVVAEDVFRHVVDEAQTHLVAVVDIVLVTEDEAFVKMVHDNFETVFGHEELVHGAHKLVLLVEDVDDDDVLDDELVKCQLQLRITAAAGTELAGASSVSNVKPHGY